LLSSAQRRWGPLNSNVRQRTQPMPHASISIQMRQAVGFSSLHYASVSLAQIAAPTNPNASPASSVALTSFGVRGLRFWCCHRPRVSMVAAVQAELRPSLQPAAVQKHSSYSFTGFVSCADGQESAARCWLVAGLGPSLPRFLVQSGYVPKTFRAA
jgi:hypothetical protein